MEEHEKIELRSDEVQEILGTPPRWIVRWGTTFIFMGIALLFAASFIVKYPDVVVVPLTITTFVEPVDVIAQKSGHLSKLLVKDNQSVDYGDILVVIQNPGKLDDVLLLDSLSFELQHYELEELLLFSPPSFLRVGNLQPTYSRFVQMFRDLSNDMASRYDLQKIKTLNNQIRSIKGSIAALEKKLQKADEEYQIADRQLKSAQNLYLKGLESKDIVERAGANRASFDKQIESIRTEIQERRVSITGIESQKINIGVSSDEQRKKKYVDLQEAINKLRTDIGQWKETNLLLSPIEGKVSLSAEYRSEQQFIKMGDRVLSIVPKEGDRIIGKALLPSAGLGRININDKVIIRLDAYPYEEFGSVLGKLESMSAVPTKERFYPAKINLPNGLMTTFDNELRFDQQMTGIAEIISKDRKFIERILDQFLKLFRD